MLDSLTVSYRGSFEAGPSLPGGFGGGGCGGREVGLVGLVVAILAGLLLDLVGEAELLSIDAVEAVSGLSLSLQETGEAGLGSSFSTVSGLTSGGG